MKRKEEGKNNYVLVTNSISKNEFQWKNIAIFVKKHTVLGQNLFVPRM